MVKRSVQRAIDRSIKSIWLNEICEEYGKGFFILEASLQNSFYHHLRCKLDELLIENDLYIYPEFYFGNLGYYADIAICKMDMSRATYHLRDRMTDVAAIIELKYGGSNDYIKTDIPKLKTYIQAFGYECQYYFGAIDEGAGRDRLNWLDRRSTNYWASGCFTELNAGCLNGTMYFEINSYNGMNVQQEAVECSIIW